MGARNVTKTTTRKRAQAGVRAPAITARGSTRRAVLDAAGELLVSRGLVALTVEEVAMRANVDRSTISRYWPSEEALAMDVLRHEWAALAANVYRRARDFGVY